MTAESKIEKFLGQNQFLRILVSQSGQFSQKSKADSKKKNWTDLLIS